MHAMAHVANGKRPRHNAANSIEPLVGPDSEPGEHVGEGRAQRSAERTAGRAPSSGVTRWNASSPLIASKPPSWATTTASRHCQRYLGFLANSTPSMSDVASALKRRQEPVCDWNAHWAPQACFCGVGLDSDFAELYSYRLHVEPALQSGISQLLEHRVPPPEASCRASQS